MRKFITPSAQNQILLIWPVLLFLFLASCGKDDEPEPPKVCTNPNFGETVSATAYSNADGSGYIRIGRVWGDYTGNLSYEWEHGATGPDISNLQPGIYNVTISDEGGCSVVKEYDLTLNQSTGYSIGDTGPAGGIVIYVNSSGGGIEAAPVSSIMTGKKWGCSGVEVQTQQGRGSGQANTNAILSSCSENDIAARLCSQLQVGGKSDWYLPSIDELSLLSHTIYTKNLSGFPGGKYWSSTEAISTMAYAENLPDGGSGPINKNTSSFVIAVRSFSE